MEIRRLGATLFLLLPTTGCTTLSDADFERRQYERATFEAEFLDYRARCNQRGKRIWVSAWSKVGRDGVPSRGDVYYCG